MSASGKKEGQGSRETAADFPGKVEALSIPVEELSDETLVRAISLGVIWALEMLYERYHRLLYSITYRMVKDHQVAEDLLQEAFLAIWQSAGSYSSRMGTVQSWLIAIMRHRTIDYLRRLRTHAELRGVPLEEAASNEDMTVPDAWDAVWRSVQGTQLRQALRMLSSEQRLIIELAYFQGWTHTEIARAYQLPLGTVKARMRLGLMRLRSILERLGATEC
jgi:RNA polymerase sigma factor (sigma-70 family)